MLILVEVNAGLMLLLMMLMLNDGDDDDDKHPPLKNYHDWLENPL